MIEIFKFKYMSKVCDDLKIDVRSYVVENELPFDGAPVFLCPPTQRTLELWEHCKQLLEAERATGGVLDIDTDIISTIDSHKPGYISRELEQIVGLQTEKPLKRAVKPFGGVRVVDTACQQNDYVLNPRITEIFTKYRKTHNDGVFSAYTQEMRVFRKTGILTGLPDSYGRGRIIGDYRRLALYGTDFLIKSKQSDLDSLNDDEMIDDVIKLREEVSEQIQALILIQKMASDYGFDVSKPASNAKEAIQWVYFAYLASVKEQDGAAMSLGNVCNFFDIYLEKDIKKGVLTEDEAQELVDNFVIKLRLVRHLRQDEYNQLFAGDPTWITESLAGMRMDGKHKVTKTTYRFLQTLYNLGPAPEPNITILWSDRLPKPFKEFVSKVSIETSSIQYENDDLMREFGQCDDYGIACCVSRMEIGKEMQFFGARCNIAKALLLAINQGKDETTGMLVVPNIPKLKNEKILDYEEIMVNYNKVLEYLSKVYIKTMNVIHYMHDKYYYERAQMAFLDTDIKRNMAFGVAGLSVVADSLSAIKYAKVFPIRDENGLTIDFKIEGDFPCYGNDDDRVDLLAKDIVKDFRLMLGKYHIYRDAKPSLSVLTITSNVIYGYKTGATPDGRKAKQPFAPGANPMHGRDNSGAIASLDSVAKIDYNFAEDGISNTFSVIPDTLGSDINTQIENLIQLIDGYFKKKAHHLNVNVFDPRVLKDAMDNPSLYPQLTIRVSGYAVNFVRLSRHQQQEVIDRTFFNQL